MIIGFSSGALWKTHERISVETFKLYRSFGCNAIELICRNEEAITRLVEDIATSDFNSFEYVGIHAPAILDTVTVGLLCMAHAKFNFDSIVVHPDEVPNWSLLEGLTLPIAIENMDIRKTTGKTIDSLMEAFTHLPKARMVLDVNHCYTIDPTMLLARQMIEAFKDRISEVHLAGNIEYHDPLVRTRQLCIMDAVPKHLPIIIESVCKDDDEAKAEFDFITNYLNLEVTKSGKLLSR